MIKKRRKRIEEKPKPKAKPKLKSKNKKPSPIPKVPKGVILVDEIKKLRMISVKTDLPPDTGETILVYNSYFDSFDIMVSHVARNHILNEQGDKTYGIWRIIAWRLLPTEIKRKRERNDKEYSSEKF